MKAHSPESRDYPCIHIFYEKKSERMVNQISERIREDESDEFKRSRPDVRNARSMKPGSVQVDQIIIEIIDGIHVVK